MFTILLPTTYLKSISEFPVFSIDWKEADYSEGHYSSILCKHLGLRHEIVHCHPQFLVDHFDKIVGSYVELFGDESKSSTFCLSRADTRREVLWDRGESSGGP